MVEVGFAACATVFRVDVTMILQSDIQSPAESLKDVGRRCDRDVEPLEAIFEFVDASPVMWVMLSCHSGSSRGSAHSYRASLRVAQLPQINLATIMAGNVRLKPSVAQRARRKDETAPYSRAP
jgi:hypothetical protein